MLKYAVVEVVKGDGRSEYEHALTLLACLTFTFRCSGSMQFIF